MADYNKAGPFGAATLQGRGDDDRGREYLGGPAAAAKMIPKAWFYRISDFWGDLSRSFCIRGTIRPHLGAL